MLDHNINKTDLQNFIRSMLGNNSIEVDVSTIDKWGISVFLEGEGVRSLLGDSDEAYEKTLQRIKEYLGAFRIYDTMFTHAHIFGVTDTNIENEVELQVYFPK